MGCRLREMARGSASGCQQGGTHETLAHKLALLAGGGGYHGATDVRRVDDTVGVSRDGKDRAS